MLPLWPIMDADHQSVGAFKEVLRVHNYNFNLGSQESVGSVHPRMMGERELGRRNNGSYITMKALENNTKLLTFVVFSSDISDFQVSFVSKCQFQTFLAKPKTNTSCLCLQRCSLQKIPLTVPHSVHLSFIPVVSDSALTHSHSHAHSSHTCSYIFRLLQTY